MINLLYCKEELFILFRKYFVKEVVYECVLEDTVINSFFMGFFVFLC